MEGTHRAQGGQTGQAAGGKRMPPRQPRSTLHRQLPVSSPVFGAPDTPLPKPPRRPRVPRAAVPPPETSPLGSSDRACSDSSGVTLCQTLPRSGPLSPGTPSAAGYTAPPARFPQLESLDVRTIPSASTCGEIARLPRRGPNRRSRRAAQGSAGGSVSALPTRRCPDRAAATSGLRKARRRLREARGCGLEARAARPRRPRAPSPAPRRPFWACAPVSVALGGARRFRAAAGLATGTHRKWAGGACR